VTQKRLKKQQQRAVEEATAGEATGTVGEGGTADWNEGTDTTANAGTEGDGDWSQQADWGEGNQEGGPGW